MDCDKKMIPRTMKKKVSSARLTWPGDYKPVSMILRLYSGFIMCIDVFVILCYFTLALFKTFLELFRPPRLKDLTGEIALIVGSSRGIGRDIAIQLAEHGVKIVCVDIKTLENENLVEKIKQNGGLAQAFECDVTNHDEVINTVNSIVKSVGPITMLFHCCGLPSPRSLVTEPPPIEKTLNLSVISHFWLLGAILPKMKKIEHGHVVFLTSVAGLSGAKHQMPLSVSQFAVQGLFESILDELRIEKFQDKIHTSLVHIYPFIISENAESDIRLRIPSAFGRIRSDKAAQLIIEGVRRNKIEISVPRYLHLIGQLIHLLPRRATLLLRELFDTGVDF